MSKLGKVLLIASVFGLLAMVLTLFPDHRVGAAPAPSTVNVDVVNTPLPVTGSVGLSGNTAANPLLVRDVDNPARHRYQNQVILQNDANGGGELQFFVPANQLLVIETVSVLFNLPSGEKPGDTFLALDELQEPAGARYELPFLSMITTGGRDYYRTTLPVRLYADPGSSIRCDVQRDSTTGTFNFYLTVSGYLVDCGAGSGCPLP
jgi:hypothetical protein